MGTLRVALGVALILGFWNSALRHAASSGCSNCVDGEYELPLMLMTKIWFCDDDANQVKEVFMLLEPALSVSRCHDEERSGGRYYIHRAEMLKTVFLSRSHVSQLDRNI